MQRNLKPINDIIFKAIFANKDNQELLKKLIKEATNLDVKIIYVRVPELINDDIRVKGKCLDLLVRCKDEEINIEVNTYCNSDLKIRNASYIFKRYSDYTRIGKSYHNSLNFIQINLNNYNKFNPMISSYTLYDKVHDKKFINNLEIYEINLIKFKEKYYNDSEPSILAMMDMTESEIEMVHGDDYMEKMKDICMDLYTDEMVRFSSPEEDEERFINTIKDCAKEEGYNKGLEKGIKEGKQQGIEQGKIDTAKRMLKESMDIELISRITNLSNEEIEKLK